MDLEHLLRASSIDDLIGNIEKYAVGPIAEIGVSAD